MGSDLAGITQQMKSCLKWNLGDLAPNFLPSACSQSVAPNLSSK